MKTVLLAIGATCAIGTSTVVGIVIGVTAGIGACSSGGGGTTVLTPATTPAPAPSSPSGPTTSPPVNPAQLAVAPAEEPHVTSISLSPSQLHNAVNNPVLWQAIADHVGQVPQLMLAELMGSYLESKYNNINPGDGSDGPWQIQLDIPGRNVTLEQARDPVWSTDWIQRLWIPAYNNQSAADKALWKTDPPHAAANLAYNAEHPSSPYWDSRHADVELGYVVAKNVMAAMGMDITSFPDVGDVTTTNASGGCSIGNSGVLATNVYQIGDSSTVGMYDQGQLEQKYAALGITLTQVAAVGSSSITASVPQLKTDTASIKAADTAVVELGANDYRASQQQDEQAIDSFVQAMKNINPAIKIYWLNTYSDHDLVNLHAVNAAITARSGPGGYTVVNWGKEAQQNRSKYSFDRQSGIHPTTAQGYSNMAQFVVKQFASTVIQSQDAPSYCKDGSAVGAEKIVCSAWLFGDYGYNFGGNRGNAQFLKGFLADVKSCVTGNYGGDGTPCKYPKGTLLVDCSGLVDAALYDAFGIDVDGVATGSYPSIPEFREIPFTEAAAGDILWKSDHTEIVTGNDPATQTFTTFGAHQNYSDVTKDIGPDTYSYTYFTKVYRVVLPGQAGGSA